MHRQRSPNFCGKHLKQIIDDLACCALAANARASETGRRTCKISVAVLVIMYPKSVVLWDTFRGGDLKLRGSLAGRVGRTTQASTGKWTLATVDSKSITRNSDALHIISHTPAAATAVRLGCCQSITTW